MRLSCKVFRQTNVMYAFKNVKQYTAWQRGNQQFVYSQLRLQSGYIVVRLAAGTCLIVMFVLQIEGVGMNRANYHYLLGTVVRRKYLIYSCFFVFCFLFFFIFV